MATTYSENLEHALGEPAVAPTRSKERIGALDFVRGWALFGILLMNITGFGLSNAYYNPLNNGGATGADLMSWQAIQIFFDGTQRGLFSLLFGAGIILLTNYLTHSVVCAIIFTGFGLFGALQRHELYYIWASICVVQLVISSIWLKHYRFGPLEWFWRLLTYWQKPSFRRPAAA